MRFHVVTTMNAVTCEEVDADSIEEILMNLDIPHPSLCFQCSNEVEITDPYLVEIFDEEGKLLHSEDF